LNKTQKEFQKNIKKKATILEKWRKKGLFWGTLAAIGTVGWMIVLPAVIGGYLGKFIDEEYNSPGEISWSITFLLIGLGIGIYSVWRFFYYKR